MASEWLVSAKIGELLASDRFDKDSIAQRELSLSQAFCLLWQNQQTGDVAGRQRPNAITDTATAAVLLDLYVLEKIDLEKEIKHWMDRKRQIVMVKVGIFGQRTQITYKNMQLPVITANNIKETCTKLKWHFCYYSLHYYI